MNRFKLIRKYCENKQILHVGCVGNWREEPHWVHGLVDEVASELVGIDIRSDKIEEIKEEGFEVYYQSAEDFCFDRDFDIVFAGELIEHLSNPGSFLESAKDNLKDSGQLIIDTPNIKSLQCFLGKILKKNRYDYSEIPREDDGHVMGFTETTLLRLLKRHNFKVKELKHLNRPGDRHTFLGRILNHFTPSRFKSQIFLRASPRKD